MRHLYFFKVQFQARMLYLVSTLAIMSKGCRQCLPLSVVQLKGKHCRKPHCRNQVVDKFGPRSSMFLKKEENRNKITKNYRSHQKERRKEGNICGRYKSTKVNGSNSRTNILILLYMLCENPHLGACYCSSPAALKTWCHNSTVLQRKRHSFYVLSSVTIFGPPLPPTQARDYTKQDGLK